MTEISNNPTFQIAVIKGSQASKEFYTAMFKVKDVIRFFKFTDAELSPELRAQRVLEESRAKKISNYLIENPDNYVIPAITASIDTNLEFHPIAENSNIGTLIFSIDTKILINDGQHRRRGLELALEFMPELAEETVPVTFFPDTDLKRAQQIFSDINSNAKNTSQSLNILYDQRDPDAHNTRQIIQKIPVFQRLTESEKGSIGGKSTKLFVLKHLHEALSISGRKLINMPYIKKVSITNKYWAAVCDSIPSWQQVLDRQILASEVRTFSITHTALGLNALGMLGELICCKYQNNPDDIPEVIAKLKDVDWDRTNPDFEGLIIDENGKLITNKAAQVSLFNYLKSKLALTIDSSQSELELDEQAA